ncbi:hypothetical protein A2Z22_02710 [Candidatus Woesebacteria bacterium RBG_16_34_12]|uniref:Uncharacterized protein n=1 Tax=Candidatus Woesebacteria bacterium RBG_16_34_12 TaxID=1802480 RepID=A0A1F7X8S5_9BACT|nr:MAG: hypothetical protein A2Z22_02710 [Candidatus Woesebacteria bacterium RBG_16_34_12]
MSDTEPIPKSQGVKRYSRRSIITTPVKAAVLSALSAIGCNPKSASEPYQQQSLPQLAQIPEPPIPNPPPSEIKEEIDINEMLEFIEEGRSMRTNDDIYMLDNTIPGIDLTYFNNPTIQKIRSISDPRKRVMVAIGWLNVGNEEKSEIGSMRYYFFNEKGDRVYTCNTYALDLLRLLLDNDDIGSRKNVNTGAPNRRGKNDYDPFDTAEQDQFNAENPFLDSNNFDGWMRKYGTENHDWRKVNNQEELRQVLAGGKGIVVGVTKKEVVDQKVQEVLRRRENGEEVEDYSGHMFVVVDIGNGFGETQATNNYLLRGYSYNSKDQLVKPEESEYNFYVHDNTPPISP